jgi:predicted TIM-barrel fold metal-dependent hydrolase
VRARPVYKPAMGETTRRTFVQSAALLPAASALAAEPTAGAAKPVIVDCHVHCFDGPRSERFPYHARAPYRPEPRLTPELLLSCMDGAGVDFGVVVHPEPYQDDHRYLEHCLEAGNKHGKDGGRDRFVGVAHYFADRPGWKQALPLLVRHQRVRALRVHAYAPERLPPFGPQLRTMWKAAADLGLIMQIHFEPHYAAGFAPLIEEFKGTPVLIDNLGRPLFATAEEYAQVMRWAQLPHVHMKLSAVPNPNEYPFRDVRPMVKQLLAAFGPERLVWGGAFGPGATPESYRAGREAIRQHFAHLDAPAQAAILGGTAMRLFRFNG